MTILDDYSSHAWSFNLKWKSDTIDCARQFIALVKNQYTATISTWCINGEGEFEHFKDLCKEHGIRHETAVPYTQQQNGCAERLNCTIQDKAQSM